MNENYIEGWHYYNKGIISTKSDCEDVKLSKKEAKALFKRFGGYYIRYTSDFDKFDNGVFYSVIHDGQMTIESLPAKTRNMVRRCLKNCEIKLVNYQKIVDDGGYDIYLTENKRYERNGFVGEVRSKERWALGQKESDARGEEFWGCYYNDKLIGFGKVDVRYREANLVTWKCDYDNYKEFYPSYGLVYAMTNHYLEREDIDYVNDGSRTLTSHSKVQDFLEQKFNYRKAYLKLNVVFRWWLIPFLMVLSPFENVIKNYKLLSFIRLYKWSR